MFFLAIYSLYVLYHLEDERICLEEVIVFAYIISFAIVDITSVCRIFSLQLFVLKKCRVRSFDTGCPWKNENHC